MWRFIIFLFISFSLFLFITEKIAVMVFPVYSEFIGPIARANFDGEHYLKIAEYGYGLYQQAFFPLFPLLIKYLSPLFFSNTLLAALCIVHVSFLITLVLLYKLVKIDWNEKTARFTILFFVFFPTSFFLLSVYTESFFLALIVGSFYAARKKNWLIAALLGILATGTKFIGIFLLPALMIEWYISNKITVQQLLSKKFFLTRNALSLFFLCCIPLGLLSYMFYLYVSIGDPLAFIHTQSAFGANRTSGQIILLPQVVYRYIQIFLHVSPQQYTFWIALSEFLLFFFAFGMLLFFRKRIRLSYLSFSLFAILVPVLSGTFSSIPRYILVAFPLFIILALLENIKLKIGIIVTSMVLLIVLTMLFIQGYFVA